MDLAELVGVDVDTLVDGLDQLVSQASPNVCPPALPSPAFGESAEEPLQPVELPRPARPASDS
jgi:hypothetical protein